MEIQGFTNMGDNIFADNATGQIYLLTEDGYLVELATNTLYDEAF